MNGFKNMLTLGRVRGFVNQGILPSFTAEELGQVLAWLDDLTIEVELIKQSVQKEWCGSRSATNNPARCPTTAAPDAATAPLIRKCCVHGVDLHRLCSRCAEETGAGRNARLVCGPDPDGEPGYPPRG